MKLDEDLPDRGPGAPVRPGVGVGVPVFLAVLLIGGSLAYIVTQSESRWYGSPIDSGAPKAERPVRTDPASAHDGGRARRLAPAGSPQQWVTDDDYPPEALRKGWQGTVSFTLTVDAQGKPSGCRVTRSSGTPMLDAAACTLLVRRARFVPARDADGRAIAASFASRFTWRIPE